MKTFFNSAILVMVIGLFVTCSKNKGNENKEPDKTFAIYSAIVKDSFYTTVHVPNEYFSSPSTRYLVVLLLDGNFFFPMMSSIVCQHEAAGLLAPAILVGIG